MGLRWEAVMNFDDQREDLKEMERLCRELKERIDAQIRLFESLEMVLEKYRTNEPIPLRRGQA
jgi:hypothetical protein